MVRCEDLVRTDAVSWQFSRPVILIFSVSGLDLQYLRFQTAVLGQHNFLSSAFSLAHLLLHQFIDTITWLLHAEMNLDPTQSFLLFSLQLFLFYYYISDLCQKGLSQHIFDIVPIKDDYISIDPIFCVILVNFFQASFDRLWSGTAYFKIGTQHFLQFLALKNSPHPFLFLRVKQQPLAIKEIVLKLTNIQVSIRKVPLSVILESIPQIETPLNAFNLERACEIIV